MIIVLSRISYVQLFAILWTIAHQALLYMGFSRQEYRSGLPCPPPRDLPDPVIEPSSLYVSWIGRWVFTTGATWKAQYMSKVLLFHSQEWRKIKLVIGFQIEFFCSISQRHTQVSFTQIRNLSQSLCQSIIANIMFTLIALSFPSYFQVLIFLLFNILIYVFNML